MARIRTIKPEFWTHEGLSALPEAVHLLAGALLNYADDEGFFNANPALVKASCSPLREPSVSIHDGIRMLSEQGYIRLGAGSDGRRYGQVVAFTSHQRINRPTPSKISKLRIVWEDSQIAHAELTEGSLPEGKGKEQGTGNREWSEEHARVRTSDQYSDVERHAHFLSFRDSYPPVSCSGATWIVAEREHAKLLDDGEDPETLRANAVAYALLKAAGTERAHNPDRWLKDGHWRGPFEIPETPQERSKRERLEQERAALERAITRAREKGYPHAPLEHDTAASYETRVDTWLANEGRSRGGSPSTVGQLLKAVTP